MQKTTRTLTRSVLVTVADTVIMGCGIYVPPRVRGEVYTPAAKPMPDAKFINQIYIRGTQEEMESASEARRQEILNEIGQIRSQIRQMAALYKSPEYQVAVEEKRQEMAEKLSTDCFQHLWVKAEKRIATLRAERAKELGTVPSSIKIDVLLKRKGVLLVNFEDIA